MLRSMICIGAVVSILAARSSDSEQAASTLLGGLRLVKLSRSFSMRLRERPYAFRIRGRESTLLTLSLPDSLCHLIATYAGLKKASRNQAYCKFMQQGLLTYLKAQISLMEPSSGVLQRTGIQQEHVDC